MSIVDRVVTGLVGGTSAAEPNVILLDLLGYDGWAAAFAVTRVAAGQCCSSTLHLLTLSGQKYACGTACHTSHETTFSATATAQRVYSAARDGALSLPGFPDFSQVVSEMKQVKEVALPQYEVCVALANGTLAIKQNLIEYWEKVDSFGAEVADILAKHNAKYNPKGLKRGCEGAEETEEAPANKKAKVQASLAPEGHESAIESKLLCSHADLSQFN